MSGWHVDAAQSAASWHGFAQMLLFVPGLIRQQLEPLHVVTPLQQLYALPSFGLQMLGLSGFPLASVLGAQHPVLVHSADVLQRHCWPVAMPGGTHAPCPVSPGTTEQQLFAEGQSLPVVQVAAHDLLPAPSSTQTAFALQHVPPHCGWPDAQPPPLSVPVDASTSPLGGGVDEEQPSAMTAAPKRRTVARFMSIMSSPPAVSRKPQHDKSHRVGARSMRMTLTPRGDGECDEESARGDR